MTGTDWPAVREALADRTDRVLAGLDDRWGEHRRIEGFTFGPRRHDPEQPPDSVEKQLDLLGGIASAIVFYTPGHRETVLVYNPTSGWEPPCGVIEPEHTPEETARVEAREETGLEIILTDLLYSGRITYEYEGGQTVPLPLAQFVGHRVDGRLRIEREGRTHPGTTRATGLFDAETLPDSTREYDEIQQLLGEPPAWEPDS